MLGTRAAFAQEDINVCQLLHIGMHCSDAFRQVWWVSLLHQVSRIIDEFVMRLASATSASCSRLMPVRIGLKASGVKYAFFMGHGPGSASESCPGRFASGLFFRLRFTSIQMHCCRAGLGSAMPSAAPAMLPPRLPQDPGAGPPATAVLSKGEGSGMAG